jgi:glycosyltransferase involved in cell wall biosynthesis
MSNDDLQGWLAYRGRSTTEHDETMRTLYICYFGLREPLVQSQVLPYLRQLSEGGIDVSLLTFEPNKRRSWSQEDAKEWCDRLQADGIRWFSLSYHKRPSVPATLYDIVVGAWTASRLARRYQIDVLHARAHVPMAMALLAQRWTGCRLVFDIRGLMADEYVDAGVWYEGGFKYRAVRRLERIGIVRADQVVVLTNRMRNWLVENELASENKVQTIPCCIEPSRFFEARLSDDVSARKRFEVVYAGSVTGLYLLDEMARFFLAVRKRRPDAFLRLLTNSPVKDATRLLESAGLSERDYWIGAVPPGEVPAYLRRARLGLSFRKPTFSQMAASPTKIPEYLAAGLPVVSNAEIGDCDGLLETLRVGVIVRSFDAQAYDKAVGDLLELLGDPDLPTRCASTAAKHFDVVRVGGPRYLSVYEQFRNQTGVVTNLATTL